MWEPVDRFGHAKALRLSPVDRDTSELGMPGELFGIEIDPAAIRRILGSVRGVIGVGDKPVIRGKVTLAEPETGATRSG
jgi:hypothetical protein